MICCARESQGHIRSRVVSITVFPTMHMLGWIFSGVRQQYATASYGRQSVFVPSHQATRSSIRLYRTILTWPVSAGCSHAQPTSLYFPRTIPVTNLGRWRRDSTLRIFDKHWLLVHTWHFVGMAHLYENEGISKRAGLAARTELGKQCSSAIFRVGRTSDQMPRDHYHQADIWHVCLIKQSWKKAWQLSAYLASCTLHSDWWVCETCLSWERLLRGEDKDGKTAAIQLSGSRMRRACVHSFPDPSFYLVTTAGVCQWHKRFDFPTEGNT